MAKRFVTISIIVDLEKCPTQWLTPEEYFESEIDDTIEILFGEKNRPLSKKVVTHGETKTGTKFAIAIKK